MARLTADLVYRIETAVVDSFSKPIWDGKPVPDAFGHKPTFKNIHTLTEQEVESLKYKQSKPKVA